MNSDEKTLDLKGEKLFPFQFQILGLVLIVAGIGLIIIHILLSITLVLIGVTVLTAYAGVEVDRSKGTYREYNSFLFIKNGKYKRYEGIEKIFINSQKVSQKIYTPHTLSSSTFNNMEYNAYLKFDDGTKIYLTCDKNKNTLMDKLKKPAELLKAVIIDNT